MWRKDFLLHGTYFRKTLQILACVFDWLYFTQCLTSLSSIDHLCCLCAVFLILFDLTQMRFFRSTHLLMFLSLETLTFIIRTGLPILVELIDLVNSVIIFLSQMTLLRWLTFLLGSQTVILIVLLFWIYLLLLTLVFFSTMALPPFGNYDHFVVVSVPLVLLVNFVSRFKLELMYMSLIVSIRSSLTHFQGFQLLVLVP